MSENKLIESNKKEVRNLKESDFQFDGRHVEGYAVVFESESEDIGWTEIIHRGAITDETIQKSDVFAKLNHDDSHILARSKKGKGSLTLEVDERGVKYSFDAPNTALGDELLEYLKRGDITSSSFAFTMPNDGKGDKWEKRNGKIYRHIYKIDKLWDVSPVWTPAYPATSCSARYELVKANLEEIHNKMKLLMDEITHL